MKRQGGIWGGILLLLLVAYGLLEGRLPLKGRTDTAVDLVENPRLFWAYAISLGVIGVAAIIWGITRRD